MISLLVMRPSPVVIPKVQEWKKVKVNGLEKTVKGKKSYPLKILSPGANRDVMEDKHWDLVKSKCRWLLEGGIMAVIDTDEAIPEKFDPDAQIKYQSLEHAKVAIAEETDLVRLKAWWEHCEEKPEMRKAIEARLTEMDNQKK